MNETKTTAGKEESGMLEYLLQISRGRPAAEVIESYQRAREQASERRRRAYQDCGVTASFPASVLYHRHSRITPDWEFPLSEEEITRLTLDLDYRTYPGAVRAALPSEEAAPMALEQAIRARRTSRGFAGSTMELADVSQLLRMSCGVTSPGRLPLRAAPSPGGLYPAECYVLAFRVAGLECGVWHYAALSGELEFVRALGGVEQLWPALPPGWRGETPAAVFVLTARLPRVQAKYGERGYRFALLESGHIAQNLLLTCAAMGVAATPVGGFFDDAMNSLTGAGGDQEPALYAILTGRTESALSA